MVERTAVPPDLEVPQHKTFQRREWKARRASGYLFAIILAAAAAGLFGGGPLAHAHAADQGLRVDYERFARHGRASEMTIRLDRAEDDQVTLAVEGSCLNGGLIESMFPRPVATTDSGDAQRFTFAATPGQPLVIRLRYLPPSPGNNPGTISVGDASVSIATFVYP